MSDCVLIEFFNSHYYKVSLPGGGVRYIPSVTTKLGIIDKPALTKWVGDIGWREANLRKYEAGQRGTRIHWAYSVMLSEGGAVVYDPWQKPVYTEEGMAELKKRFKNVAILRTQEEMWDICKLAEQFKRLKPTVLGIEEMVYNLEENIAGSIDHIFSVEEGNYSIAGAKPLYLPGGIYIGDLKTGHYVDDNVFRQLAPYALCWEKKHGAQVAGALVTHTGSSIKTGVPGLKTIYRPRDVLFAKDLSAYKHAAALWDAEHEGEEPQTFEFPSLIQLNLKEPNR